MEEVEEEKEVEEVEEVVDEEVEASGGPWDSEVQRGGHPAVAEEAVSLPCADRTPNPPRFPEGARRPDGGRSPVRAGRREQLPHDAAGRQFGPASPRVGPEARQ